MQLFRLTKKQNIQALRPIIASIIRWFSSPNWPVAKWLWIGIAALILNMLVPSCQPFPSGSLTGAWNYTDVRQVGAAGTQNPSLDLLALYTRQRGVEFQVRLDFLDLTSELDYDVYLVIDNHPGGTARLPLDIQLEPVWDLLVAVPGDGGLQVLSAGPKGSLQPAGGYGVRVVRDPVLDMVTVSINANNILGMSGPQVFQGISVLALVTSPGSTIPSDQLGPVQTADPPPPPARVLFAFWNSFPAYTPAQALRRWDGAHTGPLGGRHGLNNLLRTAKSARIPLVLLDLKEPSTLAALQYAGGLGLVKDSVQRGLLALPQVLLDARFGPSSPSGAGMADYLGQTNRRISQELGLPSSPFLFSPNGLPPEGQSYQPAGLVFYPAPDADPLEPQLIWRWKDLLAVPLPGYAAPNPPGDQVGLEGLALDARRALAKASLENTPESDPVLILGGDLPGVAWGNPQAARAAFQYIKAHPWIHTLSAHELITTSPVQPQASELNLSTPALPSTSTLELSLLDQLQDAPDNQLTQAAWEAYQALYARAFPFSPLLPDLRRGYLGQVKILLAASRWLNCAQGGPSDCIPQPVIDCASDPDEDGTAECLLTTSDFFGVFEGQGAVLTSAFVRWHGDVHQLIAPSYQLTSGQSDSTLWDLDNGVRADPSAFPGAFQDVDVRYLPEIQDSALVYLPADDGGSNAVISKTYRIEGNRLTVEYRITAPAGVQIPLTLDPWARFSSGWEERYRSMDEGQAWGWQLIDLKQPGQPAFQVQVRTNGQLTHSDFTDSLKFQGRPEDPNRDYPPGHYLPFPIALAHVMAANDFFIELEWGE